jgi:hypothetical protein
MKKSLKNEVVQYMDSRVDAIGFAPVEDMVSHLPACVIRTGTCFQIPKKNKN